MQKGYAQLILNFFGVVRIQDEDIEHKLRLKSIIYTSQKKF